MQYALCPFCFSTLQVTGEQLEQRAGFIRCGHCNDVLDAHENQLIPSIEEIERNAVKTKAQKPAFFTPEISEYTTEPPTAPIWEKATTKPGRSLPYGLFAIILIITFIAQLSYIESESLTQNIALQPLIKKLNTTFNLNIPRYKNLDEIQIIERQLAVSAQLSDTLSLQLTIKNNALVEQDFPTINVILTTNFGEKSAQGTFTKYDYLKPNQAIESFAPQALKQITLSFKKPEKEAFGFEISFLP